MTELRKSKPEELTVTIRVARPADVEAMLALFAGEVRAGRMLPRDPERVRANIDDWLAAVDENGRIVGCVSLVYFNENLCEVRSLAVHPAARGGGLGSALVQAAIHMARAHGRRRVLTLTRAPALFEQLGFRRDIVLNFPEKVWTDCAPCPLKEMCDEVALVFTIEQTLSNNGNGKHGSG